MAAATKQCTLCKERLELEKFSYKNKQKAIRSSRCKDCSKAASKSHYENNKEAYFNRNKKNNPKIIKRNQEFIIDFLLRSQCVDCAESDIRVLDFDHVKDKEFEISEAIKKGVSIDRIKKEINKCEVRCANCHKEQTLRRAESDARTEKINVIELTLFKQDEIQSAYNNPDFQVEFKACAENNCTDEILCSKCIKKLSWKKFYYRNHNHMIEQSRLKRKVQYTNNKQKLYEFLQNKSCQTCKNSNIKVLEFHHHDQNKEGNVGSLVYKVKWEKVQKEIDKCSILCANCHRKTTSDENNWYKSIYLRKINNMQ